MTTIDMSPRDRRASEEDPETVPSTPPVPEAEDGGIWGWLQVAGSAALYFNHLGLLNSFGVFQTYYETELLRDSSPSAISWIGSVQVFFFMAIAVIIGPLFDMGFCRVLVAAGTVFETVGFMLTSLASAYWHVLLAQGVCIGLGTCLLSIPSMAVVPMYFKRRRALAMATATAGSGLGATLYPLLFQRLRVALGFGWTMRVLGFLSLATCLFALAVIRTRRQPQASPSPSGGGRGGNRPAWQQGAFTWRWFVDFPAFRDRHYLLYCMASFFSNLAFFIPGYFVQGYALTHGMHGGSDGGLAAYLLPIMNASSIFGRLAWSALADTSVGALDTFTAAGAMSGASVLYWISASDPAGNVAFAVLWGIFSGGFVALANVVLTGITPDLSRLGTRLGMVSIIKGVGSLIGPPISGAILDASGRYLGVQLFSASGMLLNAILMVCLRVLLMRRGLLGNKEQQSAHRSDGDEPADEEAPVSKKES